jgi:nucleotide-binding universal stress UspA family protein
MSRMTARSHRFVSDLVHGSASRKVRHEADVPVLLLRAEEKVIFL